MDIMKSNLLMTLNYFYPDFRDNTMIEKLNLMDALI